MGGTTKIENKVSQKEQRDYIFLKYLYVAIEIGLFKK